MTLQRYTDTILASHYSDIHVSIPPDPDFGTFTKCNDGGSWGGWNVSTVIPTLQRLDTGSIQHLMTLQRYEDTVMTSHYSDIHVRVPPDPDFGTFTKCNDGGSLRWMKCFHCHPNSSKTWYWVHTTFDDPTKICRHRYDITLQQHSCEYTPRCWFWHFHKVQWWLQLRWMTCLKCHPKSSKAWYRAHATFDDPTKIYRHLSGITLQWHIHVSIPPDFAIFWTWKAQMVAVEVDDMSQMSSQLFKGLI